MFEDNYKIKRKPQKIKRVFFLFSCLFTLLFLFFLSLPYIYTAPALTPKTLATYNRFIRFTQNHDKYKDIELGPFGRLSIGENSYILDHEKSRKYIEKILSEKNIEELSAISKQLYSIGCNRALRIDDMVLFFRDLTPILPRKVGVLYSLYGKNPNRCNIDELKSYGPFIEISDQWYASERLAIEVRFILPIPMPKKSLINHSLKTGALHERM